MRIITIPCDCCSDTVNLLELNSEYLAYFNKQEDSMDLIFSDSELKDLAKQIQKRFSKKGFSNL
jgi:hypothetical protein